LLLAVAVALVEIQHFKVVVVVVAVFKLAQHL
jgi:hypothetical protein